jgi:hypothetical protein
MPFSQTDFNEKDIQQKLIVIINDSMGVPPLHPFSKLTTRQKKQFDTKMNEYIANLPPDEEYLEVIDKDFNTIMLDFFETMKPEDQFVRNINTDVIPMSSLDVVVE